MDEERQLGRDDTKEEDRTMDMDGTASSSTSQAPVDPGPVVAPGFPVGSREWYQALPTMQGQNLDHIPTAAEMEKDASSSGGVNPSMDVSEIGINEVGVMITEIENWIQEIRDEMPKEEDPGLELDMDIADGMM